MNSLSALAHRVDRRLRPRRRWRNRRALRRRTSVRTIYNYFRDYDASTGRYTESDPVGLAAGVNTYAYVGSGPVNFVDPGGLDETLPINTSGGRHAWDGPTNGAWGGKCWSGGQYSCGGHPMGTKPPTDSGDACYMHHDNCWANCGGDKLCMSACNRTLVKELQALPADPSKWPQPPRQGTNGQSNRYRDLAIWYFTHVAP
jgi:RHS repeat-associated protein